MVGNPLTAFGCLLLLIKGDEGGEGDGVSKEAAHDRGISSGDIVDSLEL